METAVFPHPDGPRNVTNSPFFTSRLKSSTTVVSSSSNTFFIFLNSIIFWLMVLLLTMSFIPSVQHFPPLFHAAFILSAVLSPDHSLPLFLTGSDLRSMSGSHSMRSARGQVQREAPRSPHQSPPGNGSAHCPE